ncbi:RIMS-binding protein 2 isoform X2 [Heterodontus francisci]|uniref:RIMS-binding protein 2 isoform X2 n=1 Tax=Heterodontus francisci TaxID=7792 RepID=UPI00355AD8FE
MWSPEQLRNELLSVQPAGPQKNIQHLRLLEERNRTLGADITVPYQEKQQERFIETELNKKRKECEILGEEVQKKQRTCQTLENELKEILHEKCHWSLQPPVLSQKVLQYDQVKPEYDHLKETLTLVTQERDLAVKEKDQLRDKLENLEQLLKHMREAAGRRQQLELEHVQALAILNTKQQEIEVLRKAQVEAKKEHEGAVLLLEAKVRELEEKCRSQSEQFNLLSRELEKFRQTAGKIDLLSCPVSVSESPVSPCKSQSQLVNGLATSLGKGNESPYGSRSVISEYIRPLQMSGGKPELLSVKPTFLSRSRPSSPRQGRLSEMDIELDGANPKMKYTGRVHLCIARYSYNPYEGPNENPEAELPLKAGKYLYVYGDMDEDGFYEGELMDGRRGLVPSNFVALLQDDELFLFHSVDTEMDNNLLNSDVNHMGLHLHGDSMLQDSKANSLLPSQTETTMYNNGTGTVDMNIDEIGEDIVPYPRKINLIKQLAKSVIVGWEPAAVPPGWGTINSYNVLVDKEVRSNIPFGGRTKALIEKLNLVNVTYRISIQSVTDRGTSDELRCTLLVGKDVCVAPSHLKVENITQVSAEVSWLPSNSNYSHVIFLNEEEYDIVKASSYKYQFFNLKPCMTCKIKAVAQPHQVPWQLPLEQREKKDSVVEFCTLPAGPPAPPQDVMVQVGSTPGTIQISWKPPLLSSSGTSNGARVTGYSVCAKGQKVAEVMLATANGVTVDYLRIQNLETREIIVRTISAQGESEDSYAAAIPTDLLVPPTPQLRPASRTKPLASARAPDTKDQPIGPNLRRDESWEQTHSPSPFHGHSLEPTLPNHYGPSTNRSGRSPSPQRILPQPQGTPIPNTVAKAIAREAAQRVAENNRAEKRSIFSERSKTLHQENSDDEEDVYDGQIIKRPSGSVDDFLRGSELGRQQHYGHADDYHTESSRGSDLSDIMEEDEEELYSEMQLDEGGRRRHSVTSHNALKISLQNKSVGEAQKECLEISSQKLHCKKLFSIPELAEEGGENAETQPPKTVEGNPNSADSKKVEVQSKMEKGLQSNRTCKPYMQDNRQQSFPLTSKRHSQEQSSSPKAASNMDDCLWEDRVSRLSREATRSPDSGLDYGSGEEVSRSLSNRQSCVNLSHSTTGLDDNSGTVGCPNRCGPVQTRGRKRPLQRQVSVEEDFFSVEAADGRSMSVSDVASRGTPQYRAEKNVTEDNNERDILSTEEKQVTWTTKLKTSNTSVPNAVTICVHRDKERLLILGNPSGSGRMSDRMDHLGRRASHGSTVQRGRPMTVPSIEITVDSNSEGGRSRSGSEGNISPAREDAYYRNIAGRRKWPLQRSMTSENQYGRYCGRERLSPEVYEESEADVCSEDLLPRVFVALFDYDPLSMSPNPDAAEEELPFKEGQIIKVRGTKDADGFYHGETNGRVGLIPCNMVSEIQTDDEEMMDQLVKQGYLPLNTPVEKIERNRRSSRQHLLATRRMVALYDYDPRESSPNVDVEAELTFCAGDIISVWGELDEDGFYYGEINGQKGLVPSNFLEEVPDDVEVYLSDAPSRYPQDAPVRVKGKRVPGENIPRRAPSPTVHPHHHHHHSGAAIVDGPDSPMWARDMASKKKKGLLSKGKKLLRKLGGVK